MAGISVSKVNLYAVLAPPLGVSVSKAVQYAVLGPPAGLAVSKAVQYAVLGSAVPPVWLGFSFGNGALGVAYSQSFSASGSQPISYSVVSGALPPGLSLSGSTIAGTPTTAGHYTFTLRASNAYGTSDLPCTIDILAPGYGISRARLQIG